MKTFEDYDCNMDQLAAAIHESNIAAGWWDGDPCLQTKLMLVVTEIAEATEGERKDLMDDHLPHRKMGEVELADALIRLLDFGARLGLRYTTILVDDLPVVSQEQAKKNPFPLHLALVRSVVCLDEFGVIYQKELGDMEHRMYSSAINSICNVASLLGYDIKNALFEKWEYNQHRADHKPENRALPGGKKV